MTVTIIGVGLIGGSFALALKDKGIADRIIGVDANAEHQQKALSLGLVDQIRSLDDAIKESDIIVLAIPVDSLSKLLPVVLDNVDHQVVIDMGSTKH